MKTKQEIEDGLRNFYCSDNYYRGFLGMLMTDGVHWLCENVGCYWITDAIMSYQGESKVKNDRMLQGIQFWTLKVNPDRSAQLILERDTNDVVLTQDFDLTDFPLDTIKLYYSPADKVCLLPSEY